MDKKPFKIRVQVSAKCNLRSFDNIKKSFDGENNKFTIDTKEFGRNVDIISVEAVPNTRKVTDLGYKQHPFDQYSVTEITEDLIVEMVDVGEKPLKLQEEIIPMVVTIGLENTLNVFNIRVKALYIL